MYSLFSDRAGANYGYHVDSQYGDDKVEMLNALGGSGGSGLTIQIVKYQI